MHYPTPLREFAEWVRTGEVSGFCNGIGVLGRADACAFPAAVGLPFIMEGRILDAGGRINGKGAELHPAGSSPPFQLELIHKGCTFGQ